jgi:hypothetical protein
MGMVSKRIKNSGEKDFIEKWKLLNKLQKSKYIQRQEEFKLG